MPLPNTLANCGSIGPLAAAPDDAGSHRLAAAIQEASAAVRSLILAPFVGECSVNARSEHRLGSHLLCSLLIHGVAVLVLHLYQLAVQVIQLTRLLLQLRIAADDAHH